MFITCQECNTTFRLDEGLLKPTGSKVRCSQCRYTFVATPPSPKPMRKAEAKVPVFEVLTEPEEMPIPAVSEEPEPEDEGLDGIDLAELDSILEGEADSTAAESKESGRTAKKVDPASADEDTDLEEIDLDFDFDAALESEDKEQQAREAPAAGAEPSDELSLDMDFEIDDDTLIVRKEDIEGLDLASLTIEEPPAKAPAKAASVSEPTLADDLDMAFKDLDLGDEERPMRKSEAPKGEDQKGENLDFLDFDLDLEGEARADEPEGEDLELSLADESEPGAKSHTVEAHASDEDVKLDLALGESLDLDLPPEKSVTEEEADELTLDLESELEMETEKKETLASASGKANREDLEELNFELDTEPAVKEPKVAVAMEEASQEDGDIDLSDIEQMLEGDAGAAKKAQPTVAAEKNLSLGDLGEIDLKDIESAIDRADEVADSGSETQEEPELELELDLDKTAVPVAEARASMPEIASGKDQGAGDTLAMDLDLELESEEPAEKAKAVAGDLGESELDLSDLGDLSEEKIMTAKTEAVNTGDIELDFQIEEDEGPAVSSKTTMGRTAGRVAEIPIEQTVDVEPKVTQRPKPVMPKKKSGKIWVILLLLLLLAAAGAGIYYAVVYMGIQIPYVSDYLKPKPKDTAGISSLTTMDINSKFIENSQSGRLFVITGKVRNGYGMRRNTIRLQGKLFTKGKVLVKTEFSYAGVQINDQELATLSIAEIKQALNAASPPLDATGSVGPGQNLPFMVVFSDLPAAEKLDEFAVELVSSLPGQ